MQENQYPDLTAQPGYVPPAYPTDPAATTQMPGYAQPGHYPAPQAPAAYGQGYPSPAQPGFAAPPQPGFAAPPQPGYAAPSPQPAYAAPPGYAAPAAQPGYPAYPQNAYPAYGQPGLFGLIFVYFRASKARSLGFPERPYWQAWAITFVCWLALVILF